MTYSVGMKTLSIFGMGLLTTTVLLSGCELFEEDVEQNTEPVQLTVPWISFEAGKFDMGNERLQYAGPVHLVQLNGFEMKRTEVTVTEYGQCVNAGACTVPAGSSIGECNWGIAGMENHPVNCVTWAQAAAFCAWLGGRLPTEAEWEYAASSGGTPFEYPWGPEQPSCDNTIMKDINGVEGCGTNRTWPVCSKPYGNTSRGLCDMAGNVAEWVEDHFHSSYEGSPPSNGAAWLEPGETKRVLRGASFTALVSDAFSVSSRGNSPEVFTEDYFGFRCAR